MKRLYSIILLFICGVSLAACQVEMPRNQGKVKVIPRVEKTEEVIIKGVEQIAEGIAWDYSADGQQLLLSNIEETNPGNVSEDAPVVSRLYVMDLATKEKEPLASSEQGISDAKFSSDGKTIGFMEILEGDFTAFVIANDQEATKQQVAVERPASPIVWFPNQDQLLLRYLTEGGIWTLGVYDLQGQHLSDLVTRDEVIYLPTFYDAQTLLYGYKQTIWAQNVADPKQVKKVVEGFDYQLTPDRRLIAYRPLKDLGGYTLQIDQLGDDLTVDQRVAELKLEWNPKIAWSPNSQYLAYSDGGVIWVQSPKGDVKKQLISGMEQIITLLWRNDHELIFSGIPREEGVNGDVQIYQIQLEIRWVEK